MVCSVHDEELAGTFMHGRSLNGGQPSLCSPATEAEDPRPEGTANQRLPARPLVNNDRYHPDEEQLYSIALSMLIATMFHIQSDNLLSRGALHSSSDKRLPSWPSNSLIDHPTTHACTVKLDTRKTAWSKTIQ